jgi:hypothetical protein
MTAETVTRTTTTIQTPSVSPSSVRLPNHHVSFVHVLSHDLVVLVILLALAFIVISALWWAFWPHHRLPRNRVRHLALRAHLRLHPGPGHATVFELWLRDVDESPGSG